MGTLSKPVDIYCERLHEGLFAEPINLVTNLSFFLAAFFLYRAYKNAALNDSFLFLLITMVAIIGIGSSAFHSFATEGTMLMDVIPITMLLLGFIAYFCRNICKFQWWLTFAALTLFLILGYLTGFIPRAFSLNGTVSYAPALFFLLLISLHLQSLSPLAARQLWFALGLLVVSMGFRSIDMLVCNIFPIGTHFIWHSLNGVVLYFAVKGLLCAAVTPAKPLK